MSKTVIILGSARSNGDTAKVVSQFIEVSQFNSIDLLDYEISQYDYDHNNRDDAFIPLMREIISKYDNLIFATPVYWYTMSGVMKMFLDRFSDLLTIEKDLGRSLRGKGFGVLSCCINSSRPRAFIDAFEQTASYLGMDYLGDIHVDSFNQLSAIKRFSLKFKAGN